MRGTHRFTDRTDAGRSLATLLGEYADRPDALVLGLARGGVPVAVEVARTLRLPVDVLVVRKVGAPHQRELAVGAVASGGVLVRNDDVIRDLGISPEGFAALAEAELGELDRRERTYRGGRPLQPVAGRVVLLVDDGLATGASMRAAAAAMRQRSAARIVVAVPVSPVDPELGPDVDQLVSGLSPSPFGAVARFYRHFDQTTDEEVVALLGPP